MGSLDKTLDLFITRTDPAFIAEVKQLKADREKIDARLNELLGIKKRAPKQRKGK